MESNFKKFFKAYLISFLIFMAIGGLIVLIYYFTHEKVFVDLVDGATLSMIVLLGLGGLMFVSREGFFDVFSYGFKQLGSAMFSKKANEYNDFPGYKENKRVKREASPRLFLSALVSGAVFIVIMIVLRIVLITM